MDALTISQVDALDLAVMTLGMLTVADTGKQRDGIVDMAVSLANENREWDTRLLRDALREQRANAPY